MKMGKIMDFRLANITSCPPCTNLRDYKEWLMMLPPTGKYGFCEDCTPKYKLEMMDQGRCEHPEIRFERDEDGFLNGTTTEVKPESLDLF